MASRGGDGGGGDSRVEPLPHLSCAAQSYRQGDPVGEVIDLYMLFKGHMNRDNPITYTLLYNIPHGQVMNINFDISSNNIQL